ncbi:hypothetical protein JAAARDRAFT_191825 [Jaapia argillacea MUCL 33604]|uniref:Dynamin-type G domain-containing protein n=1 Tax=Jaapia argillacea MUCL 33604 TaxID=933084 RepID=A0A067QCZ6_9AGAM|nr:hypothetical protein JAAARDRAFT_191825 [Jaapia argillacea MUCL 33604]
MATEDSRLSNSTYATRRKELLSLVKQLRAIGAQADLDLPRIAVIGNQSAGKSSVVEAISGINVPRDSGTCTRCPMECRLSSSSEPWCCQISIRWEFDDQGKRKDKVQEVTFGGPIHDKSAVELALRRAQAAVLNPHIALPKFFVKSDEELKALSSSSDGSEQGKTLSFSKNAVCIDLVGPDLTDLSFIDLPGIIQNAEPEVVNLVEDLVVSHIKGNCLILVALPMTDDIENQKALRLALKEDPAGRRTIGVMTKPDMLSSGATKSRELWLDIIEGRRHSLSHGYYCTRQPDDVERARGISAAEARDAEAAYFSQTSPWATATHQHRFGTTNLVVTLSKLLTQIINDSLPKLQLESRSCLDSCTSQLQNLPQPIEAEPATYVLGLITQLCNDVNHFIEGGIESGQLIHENRDAFKAFKAAVAETAPNFLPYESAGHRTSNFQNYLGDEEEGQIEGLMSQSQPVYLTDMRDYIEKSITRELPDDVPFPCKVALINSYQYSWDKSALECFNRVREDTLKVLLQCVKSKFRRYDVLHNHLKGFMIELVKRHSDRCIPYVESILEIERAPYTQNGHYYDACKDKWLAKYKDARAGKPSIPAQQPAPRPKHAKARSSNLDVGAPPFMPNAKKARGLDERRTEEDSSVPGFGHIRRGAPSLNGEQDQAPSTPVPISQGCGDLLAQTDEILTIGAVDGGDRETSSPFTHAHPWLPPSRSQRLKEPVSVVSASPPPPARSRTLVPPAISGDSEVLIEVLAGLIRLGFHGITIEDLAKLHPPDIYSRELSVMAQVRAYFQVSYKRVIDNIPLIIDLKFVRAIGKDLQPFLIGKLGLGTPNASIRCASYLAEDPHIVARRDELVARKKRLESVELELYNFGL